MLNGGRDRCHNSVPALPFPASAALQFGIRKAHPSDLAAANSAAWRRKSSVPRTTSERLPNRSAANSRARKVA